MVFKVISSEQIRAARAMLHWTAEDLAAAANIGVATIRRMEVMKGIPSGQVRTLHAIQEALENAGIEFLGSREDSPGVRLHTRRDQ